MKLIAEKVEVELKKGWPMRIHWDGRAVTVTRLIDCWVAQGRWWAREEKRIYFQLDTRRGAIEIYRSGLVTADEAWVLARIFD
jgi:hypothetical protein